MRPEQQKLVLPATRSEGRCTVPEFRAEPSSSPCPRSPMSQVLDLDRTDRALLRALTANARASGASLAATLNIAESTVSLRLRRLQTSGAIRRYRVDLDPLVLGATVQALIAIRLAKHARD